MREVEIRHFRVEGGVLKQVGRNVYLVGKLVKKKIEFAQYENGPPVLEQCGSCANALIGRVVPSGCDDSKNIGTLWIECGLKHDLWRDGLCAAFAAGTPNSLPSSGLSVIASDI